MLMLGFFAIQFFTGDWPRGTKKCARLRVDCEDIGNAAYTPTTQAAFRVFCCSSVIMTQSYPPRFADPYAWHTHISIAPHELIGHADGRRTDVTQQDTSWPTSVAPLQTLQAAWTGETVDLPHVISVLRTLVLHPCDCPLDGLAFGSGGSGSTPQVKGKGRQAHMARWAAGEDAACAQQEARYRSCLSFVRHTNSATCYTDTLWNAIVTDRHASVEERERRLCALILSIPRNVSMIEAMHPVTRQELALPTFWRPTCGFAGSIRRANALGAAVFANEEREWLLSGNERFMDASVLATLPVTGDVDDMADAARDSIPVTPTYTQYTEPLSTVQTRVYQDMRTLCDMRAASYHTSSHRSGDVRQAAATPLGPAGTAAMLRKLGPQSACENSTARMGGDAREAVAMRAALSAVTAAVAAAETTPAIAARCGGAGAQAVIDECAHIRQVANDLSEELRESMRKLSALREGLTGAAVHATTQASHGSTNKFIEAANTAGATTLPAKGTTQAPASVTTTTSSSIASMISQLSASAGALASTASSNAVADDDTRRDDVEVLDGRVTTDAFGVMGAPPKPSILSLCEDMGMSRACTLIVTRLRQDLVRAISSARCPDTIGRMVLTMTAMGVFPRNVESHALLALQATSSTPSNATALWNVRRILGSDVCTPLLLMRPPDDAIVRAQPGATEHTAYANTCSGPVPGTTLTPISTHVAASLARLYVEPLLVGDVLAPRQRPALGGVCAYGVLDDGQYASVSPGHASVHGVASTAPAKACTGTHEAGTNANRSIYIALQRFPTLVAPTIMGACKVSRASGSTSDRVLVQEDMAAAMKRLSCACDAGEGVDAGFVFRLSCALSAKRHTVRSLAQQLCSGEGYDAASMLAPSDLRDVLMTMFDGCSIPSVLLSTSPTPRAALHRYLALVDSRADLVPLALWCITDGRGYTPLQAARKLSSHAAIVVDIATCVERAFIVSLHIPHDKHPESAPRRMCEHDMCRALQRREDTPNASRDVSAGNGVGAGAGAGAGVGAGAGAGCLATGGNCSDNCSDKAICRMPMLSGVHMLAPPLRPTTRAVQGAVDMAVAAGLEAATVLRLVLAKIPQPDVLRIALTHLRHAYNAVPSSATFALSACSARALGVIVTTTPQRQMENADLSEEIVLENTVTGVLPLVSLPRRGNGTAVWDPPSSPVSAPAIPAAISPSANSPLPGSSKKKRGGGRSGKIGKAKTASTMSAAGTKAVHCVPSPEQATPTANKEALAACGHVRASMHEEHCARLRRVAAAYERCLPDTVPDLRETYNEISQQASALWHVQEQHIQGDCVAGGGFAPVKYAFTRPNPLMYDGYSSADDDGDVESVPFDDVVSTFASAVLCNVLQPRALHECIGNDECINTC